MQSLIFLILFTQLTVNANVLTVQPVSFTIFTRSDGTTGHVPYQKILTQIDQLNHAFSGKEAENAKYTKTVDTNIRFRLAGVRYVQNDYFFDLCTLPTVMKEYRPKYMMNGSIHLNVFSCSCKHQLGLSWLPYDKWYRDPLSEDHYSLGITLHWELFPPNKYRGGLWSKGNILTHEVGHHYGLKHPYENGCFGEDGDGIDDTPRMKGNPLKWCKQLRGRDSCPNKRGKDDLSNYMLATADNCRNHFTPGQVRFMHDTIRRYKPTLSLMKLPGCIAAINNTDTSPDLQPCVSLLGEDKCRTDPDDAGVWAWKCCPTNSLDWEKDSCRLGRPQF